MSSELTMELEPFVRYRAQLAALAGEESVRLALQRAPFWPSHLRWTPIFERFYPGAGPYAVQVFESFDMGVQRDARVEAFDQPPGNVADGKWWSTDDRLIGSLRVTTLAADRD